MVIVIVVVVATAPVEGLSNGANAQIARHSFQSFGDLDGEVVRVDIPGT